MPSPSRRAWRRLSSSRSTRPAQLSPEQAFQATYFRNAVFKGFENLFFQYRQGLITEGGWKSYEFIIRANARVPDFDAWWSTSREGFDGQFQACVEDLLRESGS